MNTKVEDYFIQKIISEMEVAPRHTLLTPFTLFTVFALFTVFTVFTVYTPFILFKLLYTALTVACLVTGWVIPLRLL